MLSASQQFKVVLQLLLLFATLQTRQRCANQYRASLGAPCSALNLRVLQQYHPEPMPAIAFLRFARSRKLDLKTFLKGNRSFQGFRFPSLKSREIFVLLNHPNQTIELRPSKAASHLISFTCLAMEPNQGATHLSENLFIKEDSCAKPPFFPKSKQSV